MKKPKPLALIIFFLLTIPQICLGSDKVITLAADYWCPYNCTPNSEQPGYIVEIAKEIFNKQGYTVIYKNLPWKRALQMVYQGQIDGIIGAYPLEAPRLIYPQVAQGISRMNFYARNDDPWHYNGITSLQHKKVGFIGGYKYGEVLDNFFSAKENQRYINPRNGPKATELNIRMLQANRLDVILANQDVMNYYSQKSQVNNSIKLASGLDTLNLVENIYIAFSPQKAQSQTYAKWLSEGMEQLNNTGKLNKILAQYNLQNWISTSSYLVNADQTSP